MEAQNVKLDWHAERQGKLLKLWARMEEQKVFTARYVRWAFGLEGRLVIQPIIELV